MAAPFIKKGLQVGIDAGVRVMAEAMPYCQMNGYERYVSERFIPKTEIRDAGFMIHDYGRARVEEGKKKPPSCVECIYDPDCEGPWKEYPERSGTAEFRPVKKARLNAR